MILEFLFFSLQMLNLYFYINTTIRRRNFWYQKSRVLLKLLSFENLKTSKNYEQAKCAFSELFLTESHGIFKRNEEPTKL